MSAKKDQYLMMRRNRIRRISPSRHHDRLVERDNRRIAVGSVAYGRLIGLSVQEEPRIGVQYSDLRTSYSCLDIPNEKRPVPVDETGESLVELVIDVVEESRRRVETLDIDRVELLPLTRL